HATGFIGKGGRGVHEHCGVFGKIDLITTTFGKALGGASGGCVSGRKEVIDYLRQRGRPYLFSNSVAPSICAGTIKALELINESGELRERLIRNVTHFRTEMDKLGFVLKGEYAIAPVMLFNAKLAQDFAADMYAEGIYVIGFSFPVVPNGQARIRVQLSAAHEPEHVDRCVAAFKKVGEKYGILGLKKKEILAKYPEAQ
ncbi:MAG: aminotransferase class I/II-fold pyridoxal phosphate-dependent enzyme, partial [Planctomycetota bacterium]